MSHDAPAAAHCLHCQKTHAAWDMASYNPRLLQCRRCRETVMEEHAETIYIDDKIRRLIDPLTEDEFNLLRDNIANDGEITDPLVVWEEEDILLDGHHRIQIADEFSLPFRITYCSFPNRTAATLWILEHQLGRRNLNAKQRSYYRGKLYAQSKKARGAPTGNRNAAKQSGQNVHFESKKTADQIGEMDGVTGKTVRRDEKYADAIDTLEQDGIPREEMTGPRPVFSKTGVKALARMEPEERREAADRVRSGEAPGVRAAVRQLEEERRETARFDDLPTGDDVTSNVVSEVAGLFVSNKARLMHRFHKEKHKFSSRQRTKVARQIRSTAKRLMRVADDIAP